MDKTLDIAMLKFDQSAKQDLEIALCDKCHTPKYKILNFGDILRKVPVMCDCENAKLREQQQEEERRKLKRRIKKLRDSGLTDEEYSRWTFSRDDRSNLDVSDVCRKYVKRWQEMFAGNVGLLLYGGVGTGKTFYACCIANALLDKAVSAIVTSFPMVLNSLQSADGKSKIIDKLSACKLLVIDDLGAERETEYALEQVYGVIDARYRSGKPLIVTTNLAPSTLTAPPNTSYKRIYDRILENCLPVKVIGRSRREIIAVEKARKYKEILGIDAGGDR